MQLLRPFAAAIPYDVCLNLCQLNFLGLYSFISQFIKIQAQWTKIQTYMYQHSAAGIANHSHNISQHFHWKNKFSQITILVWIAYGLNQNNELLGISFELMVLLIMGDSNHISKHWYQALAMNFMI